MTERYQNGKIYKLVSDVSDDVYYGSTCLPLAKRLWKHKDAYKRYKKGTFNFVTSFKILELGLDSVDIVLVEEYPCDSKMELHKRERYHIENTECVNKVVPTRTRKEYVEVNKEQRKQNQKKYRDTHKTMINLKVQCTCGTSSTYGNISRHRKSDKHLKHEEELRSILRINNAWNDNMLNMCRQFKELFSKLKI